MGLMNNNPYAVDNPIATALNSLRSGFKEGYAGATERRKIEADRANQILVQEQQAELLKIQTQEAQRKQTLFDQQRAELARLNDLRSQFVNRMSPQQTPLVGQSNELTPAGRGLMPQGLMGDIPQTITERAPAEARQQWQDVANPLYGQQQQAMQQIRERGSMQTPAAPLTQAELLKYGMQGDANMNAAIGHYQTAQGNDAKLENLREMLTLKNQYAVDMASAKNEYQQQAIKDKFDNALALQSEKYDLLKGVKMAGVRGGSSKAPMGYRYNGDMLEPIPGGPADQKGQDRAKAAEGASLMLDSTIGTLNELMTHPGRKGATGTIKTAFIPGTDAADWAAKLDTFKAQTFLPMVQSMKGMGALSDAEGKKLTEAVGALDRSRMSEKGMYDSMTNIMKELEAKRALANKYAPQAASPAAATSSTPKVGEMRGGYMYMGGDPSNRNSWGKR